MTRPDLLDLRAALDADCRALADAIRSPAVSRDQRRQARQLLGRAFEATAPAEGSAAEIEDLLRLSHAVDRALAAARPESGPRLSLRIRPFDPVRIRPACRPAFLQRHDAVWLKFAERLSDRVDWFWIRCAERAGLETRVTVREREYERLAGPLDAEYVWGRVKS